MRKLVLLSGLLPCLLLVAGCPKKGGDATDGAAEAAVDPDAAAANTPPPNAPPVPEAKNKADVARFQNETAVADDEAKPATFVSARTSPKGGSVVASLKPGTDIHKHAEYQDCFLVTFPDPKDASTTLMGWIEKSSFTYVAPKDAGPKDAAAGDAAVDAGAPAPVDAGPPKCAATDSLVILSAGAAPVCKKKCKEDKDCKTAPCANANTPTKTVARVCTHD
jgi:hypothetical protein